MLLGSGLELELTLTLRWQAHRVQLSRSGASVCPVSVIAACQAASWNAQVGDISAKTWRTAGFRLMRAR